jgi:hypothetical protein
MSKGENIVKWIKGQRINWLGHLQRMEEDKMPKNIFTQELEGTRRRGRRRKDGKRKLKEIFKCWETEDGESWWQVGNKWRNIVRRAKAHSGL